MANKAAAYCFSANMSEPTKASVYSLLKNNPDVHVYVFCENADFDYPDERVTVRNSLELKKYFNECGPNFNSMWTWYASSRLVLFKILRENRCLYLDCDTIIDRDISELWELDMSRFYYAMVQEPQMSAKKGKPYFNNGINMMNLKKLRDGTGERVLMRFNTVPYLFKSQDCMNEECAEQILALPNKYNQSKVTGECWSEAPAIIHYASINNWWKGCCPDYEYYSKYREEYLKLIRGCEEMNNAD